MLSPVVWSPHRSTPSLFHPFPPLKLTGIPLLRPPGTHLDLNLIVIVLLKKHWSIHITILLNHKVSSLAGNLFTYHKQTYAHFFRWGCVDWSYFLCIEYLLTTLTMYSVQWWWREGIHIIQNCMPLPYCPSVFLSFRHS